MLAELINSFGSLIASIGALVAAVTAAGKARNAERNTAKLANTTNDIRKEVSPNHGSSMKDSLVRIEKLADGLGHQIGEIRRDAAVTHELLGNQVKALADRMNKHDI